VLADEMMSLEKALAQIGVVRIASNHRYNTVVLTPEQVPESLRSLTKAGSHTFVPDD
jgi:hypothetical protein